MDKETKDIINAEKNINYNSEKINELIDNIYYNLDIIYSQNESINNNLNSIIELTEQNNILDSIIINYNESKNNNNKTNISKVIKNNINSEYKNIYNSINEIKKLETLNTNIKGYSCPKITYAGSSSKFKKILDEFEKIQNDDTMKMLKEIARKYDINDKSILNKKYKEILENIIDSNKNIINNLYIFSRIFFLRGFLKVTLNIFHSNEIYSNSDIKLNEKEINVCIRHISNNIQFLNFLIHGYSLIKKNLKEDEIDKEAFQFFGKILKSLNIEEKDLFDINHLGFKNEEDLKNYFIDLIVDKILLDDKKIENLKLKLKEFWSQNKFIKLLNDTIKNFYEKKILKTQMII